MSTSSNLYCLEQGPIKLVVDLSLGARIVEFSFNGKNTLTTTGPQVGSTFWPSPQAIWDWPPPAALDSAPYKRIQVDDGAIFAHSEVCEQTKLQLKKRFEKIAGGIRVTYTMRNAGNESIDVAPWEISRIYGGLSFYASEQPALSISTLAPLKKGDCYWHDYSPAGENKHLKLFANNSEGWLANIHAGLMLVKRFETVDAGSIAPGEAEVEIYAHGDPDNAYIEIEQQGEYESLAPGAESVWVVDWLLAGCDEGVVVEAGNSQLTDIVRSMLER